MSRGLPRGPFGLRHSPGAADRVLRLQLVCHVRRLRKERGISQRELASRVSVTAQSILAVEYGRKAPSLIRAFGIADALGFPLAEAFSVEPV